MKKSISILAVFIFGMMIVNAQENVDVKKETVTKKVITKGTTVETTVINDIKEERNVINVVETDDINQVPTVISDSNEKTEVTVDTIVTNEDNIRMIDEYRKKEQDEVQKSIDAQRAEKKRIDSDVDAIKKANLEEKKVKTEKKKKDNL